MLKSKGFSLLGLILIIGLSITGCKSKFEKLRESSDTGRKYQEAIKLYNKKDYTKALSLFDDLVQRYRGRSEAEDLYYYYAYTNYKLKDYISARYHFKTFADTYPSSPKAEECRFMTAYCMYLESPVYSLDQDNTYKAIESFQLFINLYPQSDRVAEASKLIESLRDKLEQKSFANAKLFLDIGDYQAAVIAFRNSIKDFPDTKYAEQIDYLTIEAQYLYAKNSREIKQEERYQEAIDEYDRFMERYPNSKYSKDANKLKEASLEGIEQAKKILASYTESKKATKNEQQQ
ncbi:outer membrane assembly lipoprotein YfiO [Pseudopedobacter saltans DSM 12145]|uniref:Outer membrane assembly lipoprotein YfiO n=1 Tax=Pseudopedobacter saltans (strain ATCC 51119 / DSM 12145 / JCM 21818 / CCUG 39354 / LMG 10337 / NBRC 100064 / NCIMB 13643) TaxID=762903 RepID=F0S514_PSESL|nr:outer membrane protein assembly factor BamD [Pseudopedobacter saltans]ADY50931.1 outer membrane assembly lipoprotein YfiO [Pseudopedobacter saltans DSM 12145]